MSNPFPVFQPNGTFNETLNLTLAMNWAKNLTTLEGFMMPVTLTLNAASDFGWLSIIVITMLVAYMKVKRLEAVAAVLILMGGLLATQLSPLGLMILFWLIVMVFAGILFKLYTRRE